ncbi:3'-5' exoribonuclease YhaM family protein [Kosmotoga pacifica]|uniref:3'-5' exoribonuclease YhaM family protein n=1 Tax=Kosmotoga pacifica TaxID=1330330 RepID=UPI000699E17D|nr:HD domain-containing protein [Kosmotoga pacifica]
MLHTGKGAFPTLSDILEKASEGVYDVENFIENRPGFFLLTNVAQKVKKTGGKYYTCTIRDSKVFQSANVWKWPENERPTAGMVAFADYTYNKFGISLKIRKLYSLNELSSHIENAENIFLPVSHDIERLKEMLIELINKVENPHLKELLEATISPEKGEIMGFFRAPAATRNHHVRIGGLLEHSVRVAELCLAAVNTLNCTLNTDLLITGALLHDVGKALTYDHENFSFDFTDAGLLEEHIVLGIKVLTKVIDKIEGFPANLERDLFHIVTSHHGLKEWGSPVVPRTLEAIIIHNCDRLEAQVDAFEELAHSVPEGSRWSDYSGMLGTKVFISEPNDDI